MQYHHIALCIKKLIIIISYHYIVPWPQNRTTDPYHCTVPWPQNRTIVPHHDLKTVPSNRTPFQASKFTPTLKIHNIYIYIYIYVYYIDICKYQPHDIWVCSEHGQFVPNLQLCQCGKWWSTLPFALLCFRTSLNLLERGSGCRNNMDVDFSEAQNQFEDLQVSGPKKDRFFHFLDKGPLAPPKVVNQSYLILLHGAFFRCPRNIHMIDATAAKITSMHFHGWQRGLKTGMPLAAQKTSAWELFGRWTTYWAVMFL